MEIGKTVDAVLNQLNAWRARYKPPEAVETDELLNRSFAAALTTVQGKQVVDYLITKYYKPIEFVGASDSGRVFERNGQQNLLVDILTRIDMGLHPMAHQESPSTEQPFDPRL